MPLRNWANAKSRLPAPPRKTFAPAKAGGRTDDAARVDGDLAKGPSATRERGWSGITIHWFCLLAEGAATKDRIGPPMELALSKAQAEVNRGDGR